MNRSHCRVPGAAADDRFIYLRFIISGITISSLLLGGCSFFNLGRPSLQSPDASLKIPAIKQAAADRDIAAIPMLIRDLNSTDPAVRFYSSYALKQITGRRLGYQFYAPVMQRQLAIARWDQWAAAHLHKPASSAGGTP
ncbi:MAG: hypothetical protein ACP5O1_08435 [Phycisphaerae bacterium]